MPIQVRSAGTKTVAAPPRRILEDPNTIVDPDNAQDTDSLTEDVDPGEAASARRAAIADLDSEYRSVAAANHEEMLDSFLRLFLGLNPQPSDEQVHSLAKAIGVSKEALEAVIYSMLSEMLGNEDDDELDVLEESASVDDGGFNRSIILNPEDTDERMANDGEVDEHNLHQKAPPSAA